MAAIEPLHISEADAVRDLAAILQHVQAGAEVVIERDAQALTVIRAAAPPRRTISECIALPPAESTATIDSDFAKGAALLRLRLRHNLAMG
jgi:antitoxin (DNA-binding transcriptional repressor) of toxin-antitoxin stability system